jgi:chromosome segregation ATPase
MLDTDASTSVLYKRQRVTPMRDLTPTRDNSSDHAAIEHMRDQLKAMSTELAAEKKARVEAEEALKTAKQEQAKSEATAAEWQRDHNGLIQRYEKQREHNRTIYKQNKKLVATNESIKTQSEKIRETNTKLRTENAELKKELADARAALTSSDNPDVATLEIARARAQTAEERAKGLERSLENTKRDFEFTRQQYQSASAQAVDLSSENSGLEKEVAALKIKASDEPRRLKELNFVEERRTMAMESERLRAENRNLDTLLQKMYAENNMLKKGRGVQTRGSSAQPPNSPGLGGFNHGAGRRSRQASPAVGVRGDRNLAVPASSGRD